MNIYLFTTVFDSFSNPRSFKDESSVGTSSGSFTRWLTNIDTDWASLWAENLFSVSYHSYIYANQPKEAL